MPAAEVKLYLSIYLSIEVKRRPTRGPPASSALCWQPR